MLYLQSLFIWNTITWVAHYFSIMCTPSLNYSSLYNYNKPICLIILTPHNLNFHYPTQFFDCVYYLLHFDSTNPTQWNKNNMYTGKAESRMSHSMWDCRRKLINFKLRRNICLMMPDVYTYISIHGYYLTKKPI